MKKRLIAFFLTAAGAGALFAAGIYRQEIGEVLFNAAML
jgi:hypothetical protein